MTRAFRLVSNDSLWPYVRPVLRRIAPDGPRVFIRRVGLLVPLYVLFVLLNLAHASFRSIGDDIAPVAPVNVAQFDIALFGTLPSAALQDALGVDGSWAAFGFFYWTTLFWMPLLLIAVAAFAGHNFFLRLLFLHMVLVLSADVIYAVVPTRPPWMDADLARIVATHSADGVHIDRNPFAALPSLHVGVPAAYALWFGGLPRVSRMRWLAPVLGAWAAGMAWCVIFTGEHYVIDVVTGYTWAALVFYPLRRLGVLYPGAAERPEDTSAGRVSVPMGAVPVQGERAA